MRISIIVAIGNSGQIGKDNNLLWHLRSDLKNFKRLTMGHSILMGRKTYESIGKPLPGRDNIVLSLNRNYRLEKCRIVNSLDAGIEYAKSKGESELFIIGGGTIYRESLDLVDRIYLTQVDFDGQADTFFPDFDRSAYSVVKAMPLADEKLKASFEILDRRRK